MVELTLTDFILRLLAAMAAGTLVGIEREWRHKRAGLRTNALVATGAAMFVLVALQLVTKMGSGDPTRVIGQVVTGIGFLGAGVILQQGSQVHGLTTAATIWSSAAIGCLAAMGWWLETGAATLAILLINIIMKPLENLIKRIGSPDPDQP